ncbi:MAG: phosphate signaling complex protein PhoU [Actinomycetota bacterium]
MDPRSMGQELRRRYHEELAGLELSIQSMGRAAQEAFERSIRAATTSDGPLSEQVIVDDDKIDAYYLDAEKRILDVFALQTPVASDLRLLTCLLHLNLHLERIGDMAVNIAKIARNSVGLPRDETVVQHLEEMGGIAGRMVGTAIEAFARRDLELCYTLPRTDDPIDRLNRGMLNQILRLSTDQALLEWGIQMHVVSRQIERIGDHAVDIGEQVAFLITGRFEEFTDASHPEETAKPGP